MCCPNRTEHQVEKSTQSKEKLQNPQTWVSPEQNSTNTNSQKILWSNQNIIENHVDASTESIDMVLNKTVKKASRQALMKLQGLLK